MSNAYFQFKQFRIEQALSGMKVTTDACLFGGWVSQQLSSDPIKILDIGAGTGLLSLMLAQTTELSLITAVELNKDAFHEACHNFAMSPWNDRLSCVQAPIQELPDNQFDLIISNPPFFKNSEQGKQSNKNQAVHSGTLPMEELLEQAVRFLSPDGTFYLLYPEREMQDFIPLAKRRQLHLQKQVLVLNQSDSRVFRAMCCFGFKPAKPVTEELIIRKENRKYTAESWKLLEPYLLEYNSPTDPGLSKES